MPATEPRPAVPERLDATPMADDVSFLVTRASALSVAAGNAALAGLGLRVRSYSVLALAADDARPSQREVAEFLRLDPSQVVALVDQLQSAGLAVREPDPRDRRTNVVVATPDGAATLARARAALAAADDALHAGLAPEELTTLASLLRRLAFPPA